MQPDIFNISFEHWGIFLLSAIPSFINAGIFIYSIFNLPYNRTNMSFSVFLLLFSIAQICDGMVRMSVTAETAELWGRVSGVPWIFVMPVGLLFTLRFTGGHKKISKPFLFAFLFLPAILFELTIAARLDKYAVVKSDQWNWIVNPEPALATTSMYIWMVGLALLMLLSLWKYYFKDNINQNKKRQTLLLAAGFTAPFIGGIIAEVIFPLVLKLNSIPLTTPLITAFSISAILSIKKYDMLDFSPRHQWQTIVDTMNEGVLIVDNSDNIMYANKMFCQITGYRLHEIKGKIAQELFVDNADHKKEIQNAIEERKEKKSSQYEIEIKTKSGEKIWMVLSGSPYLDRDGNVIGSIGIQTNITHLKELEKNLQYSNIRLKDAQAIAHVGNWELNFETNIAVWSEEACRIYGLSTEDKIHSFERWMKFIHPEDLSYVQKEIQKSQATFSDSSFKHRIIWKDGTVKYIHSISRFEMNAKGIPIDMYGTCQDITEQHTAEIALIESENKIRNFATHLNNTLENERAYIAREIHDELGQYLTGIKLGLASFNKLFQGNDKMETRIRGMITDIESAQQTVRKIVNKIRPGILDTLGLIPSIKWLVKEFEIKKEMKYNVEITGSQEKYKPNISICFFRVCQEALTNISRHSKATKADIKIIQTKNEFILSITDNGKGISNEQLRNPFSTGLLGMRERANSIGAELLILSKENHGTTIQLELKIK